MHIIQELSAAHLSQPAHVTIGAFDGVHRGHRRLIGAVVKTAHAAGQAAVAVTFDPHPGAVLGRRPVAALSTLEERATLLARLGLDLLAVLSFTSALAGLSAREFVAELRQHLQMVAFWCGPDFALGRRREGDVSYLRELGEREGFGVHIVEPLRWRGEAISSSRIRVALTAGDIEEATRCLGRFYHLAGVIVRGRGLGRLMGVPTANLQLPPGRLVPANGVYACMAHLPDGTPWPAVVNVGVRPTVSANGLTVEAHLLDFAGDLYDQSLGVDFVARLRDEEKFPTLAALTEQIHEDVARARHILSGYSRSTTPPPQPAP